MKNFFRTLLNVLRGYGISISWNEEVELRMKEMRDCLNIKTNGDVIRFALSTLHTLSIKMNEGCEIVIKYPDGTEGNLQLYYKPEKTNG